VRSCILSQLPACVGTLYGILAPIEAQDRSIGSYFTPKSESPIAETKHLHNIMTSVAEAAAPSGSVSPDTAPSSMGVAGATTLSGSINSDTVALSSEKPSVEVRA
jgi:hypothetical protein